MVVVVEIDLLPVTPGNHWEGPACGQGLVLLMGSSDCNLHRFCVGHGTKGENKILD